MENLQIKENSIVVKCGEVVFTQKEDLLNKANMIAEYLDNLEITEDNIKEAKKVLANSNKALKSLDDERKKIKKQYEQPYKQLEQDIKEIKEVIEISNDQFKSKIKDIEEAERINKLEELENLFNKGVEIADLEDVLSYEDWFKPEMLNKTYTIKKAKENLTLTLNRILSDIESIKVLSDIKTIENMPSQEDVMIEYLTWLDLSVAIKKAQLRKKRRKVAKRLLKGE